MASGLQRGVDLLLHVSAYDINCQYRIHFDERMLELYNTRAHTPALSVINMNVAKLFPWTVAGVGKFHLAGHKPDCRYKWSFHFLPHSAIMDGEAPERIWSVLNLLGLRTREMNPGFRHDMINEFYGYMNIKRVHGIGIRPIGSY